MKRLLVSAGLVAASVCVHAQSSVLLFGVADIGVGRTSGTGAGHVDGVLFGGNTATRLGFRATEDLGGGLAANVWMEGQLNMDTGTGSTGGGFDFLRRSTVSLLGRFGEVRLGRDYLPSYLNMVNFDAWSRVGFGSIEITGPAAAGGGPSYVRNSNTVAYLLPSTLGGIYGHVQYAFGEQQSDKSALGVGSTAAAVTTKRTGNFLGGRLGYASGRLDVGGAYSRFYDATRSANTPATFFASDYQLANIGVSYDFGFVKPLLFVQQERIDGNGAVPAFVYNTVSLSARVPLGAGMFRAGVSHYDIKNSANDFNKVSLGYVYSLSKRTSLYADLGRISNKGASRVAIGGVGGSIASGAPLAGGNSTGIAFGITHAF
ncbi:MAG: porin [Pseudomonadota bacterium]